MEKTTRPLPVLETAWMIIATAIVTHRQLFTEQEDVVIYSTVLCYVILGIWWRIVQVEHEWEYDYGSRLSVIGYVGPWWTGVLGLAIAGHYSGLWEIEFPIVSSVAVVLLALAVYHRRKVYSNWKRGYGASVKFRVKH